MFEILGKILELAQQCALIVFLIVLAYTVFKLVQYFTLSDNKAQAIDDEKEKQWNSGQHILIGHQSTTQSVLKQIVDNKEKSIDEGTYIKFSARLKEIKKEFGEDSDVHIHLQTPGGEMFYAMLIAHQVFLCKGTVTAHIHYMSCSGGTLIALCCDKIVMAEDSVLGPIDPQVPKRADFSSVTQLLLAAGIDPLAEQDAFTPFVPLKSVPKEKKGGKDDDDAEKEVKISENGVEVVNKEGDGSEMMAALKLNILVLDALSLLKTYKSFLQRVLQKNYNNKEKVEEIIRFFWTSRPHSTPIFMEECRQIGLHVVKEGEEEEMEEGEKEEAE